MLNIVEIGGGRVSRISEVGWRLSLPPLGARQYADAQLDDYGRSARHKLPDSPPVALRLQARTSHPQPLGTLGFGFWNNPFTLTGGGVLAAPNTVWFFYASPPSDLALAEGVPGFGWKAATLNAGRYPSPLLAPAAAVAVALTFVPGLGAPVMAAARRFVQACEALLDDVALTEWHTYEIDWRKTEAVFRVDGVERLRSPAPPHGPLGLVLWIDNQYAIASRAGRFGFGLCATPEEQWLEIEDVQLLKPS
ncbi:MAG: hypothetical protein NZM11_01610 [Anaerolineales bacterium]|nr:hypothetical protein [Anaerolineales bacterium]